MVSLNFGKGIIIARLVKDEKAITSFMLEKNSGYANLQKFPWKIYWMNRIIAPIGLWEDIDDFKLWLKDQFSHYDDGVYYLLVYRDSVSRAGSGIKQKKRIRKLEPFAKFEIRGGSVEMPDTFRKSARTSKTHRVYLLLEKGTEEVGLTKKRRIKF